MRNEDLYYIQERINELKAYLEELQMRRLEYEVTKKTIKELKEGDEVLVPLGSGIFFKATAKKVDKVFVNIGADVIAEKDVDKTVELIDEQIEKVKQMMNEVMDEIEYWQRVLEEYARPPEEKSK